MKYVAIISFVLLLFFSACSVSDSVRVVGWTVDDEYYPVTDATASVYEGDDMVEEIDVNQRGRFVAYLQPGSYYIISVDAPGTIAKKFSFDTQLPQPIATYRNLGFEFVIDLFPYFPGADIGILEQPLIDFYFDPSIQNFYFDENKYDEILVKVDDKKEYMQRLFEKRQDHADIIEQADTYYQENDYDEALKLYSQAAELEIPGDDHSYEMINSIFRKLEIDTAGKEKEEMVAEEVEAIDTLQQTVEEDLITGKDMLVEEDSAVGEDIPAGEDLSHHEDIQEQDNDQEVQDIDQEVVDRDSAIEEEITISRSIAFDSIHLELTDEQIEQIQKKAELLLQEPGFNLIIHSQALITGSKHYNFYLAKTQSNLVVDHFINSGIDKSRLFPVYYYDSPGFVSQSTGAGDVKFEIKQGDKFYEYVNNSSRNSLRFLNNFDKEPKFHTGVEFLVQFLAAENPANPGYYETIMKNLPGLDIYYYLSDSMLHHYSVGNIFDVSRAMEVHRQLRSLGYDTYIIVLNNGKRVLTTEIN